jgi:hypothetical protein
MEKEKDAFIDGVHNYIYNLTGFDFHKGWLAIGVYGGLIGVMILTALIITGQL